MLSPDPEGLLLFLRAGPNLDPPPPLWPLPSGPLGSSPRFLLPPLIGLDHGLLPVLRGAVWSSCCYRERSGAPSGFDDSADWLVCRW